MPDGEPDIVNCDVVASNCPKIPGGCTSHEIIALLAPCAASITIFVMATPSHIVCVFVPLLIRSIG